MQEHKSAGRRLKFIENGLSINELLVSGELSIKEFIKLLQATFLVVEADNLESLADRF